MPPGNQGTVGARRRDRGARNDARGAGSATRDAERDRELGHQLDDRIMNDRYGVAGAQPLGAPVDDRSRVVRELERMGPRLKRRVRELGERVDPKSVASLAVFAAATAGAAWYGSGAYSKSRLSRSRLWYRRIEKPPFTPPDWVFGPVWTSLYALIAASGWRVWERRDGEVGPRTRSAALALWATQLGLNAAWSRAFFGRRRPDIALADVGLMLAAIGGYTAVARRVDRSAAWMMAPYLAWTAFAGALNFEIVRRNR